MISSYRKVHVGDVHPLVFCSKEKITVRCYMRRWQRRCEVRVARWITFFIFVNPSIPINLEEGGRFPFLLQQSVPPFLLCFFNHGDDAAHADTDLTLLQYQQDQTPKPLFSFKIGMPWNSDQSTGLHGLNSVSKIENSKPLNPYLYIYSVS